MNNFYFFPQKFEPYIVPNNGSLFKQTSIHFQALPDDASRQVEAFFWQNGYILRFFYKYFYVTPPPPIMAYPLGSWFEHTEIFTCLGCFHINFSFCSQMFLKRFLKIFFQYSPLSNFEFFQCVPLYIPMYIYDRINFSISG